MANKQLRTEESRRDFISRLPDPILWHIMSFLPTKDAVATAVLSTRWRYLFTYLTVLDFDDSFLFEHSTCKSTLAPIFTEFVKRLLSLSEGSPLDKFRLKCSYFNLQHSVVKSWVFDALSRNVQELDLCIRMNDIIILPEPVFTSGKLVVLKLCGRMFISVPDSIYLPCLKSLHLVIVWLEIKDSLNKLISSCPMLEDLVIDNCTWDLHSKEINILSPTLKSFYFNYCDFGYQKHKLIVDAPSLLALNLCGDPINEYSTKNLLSLRTAEINLMLSSVGTVDRKDVIHGLVNGMCCVKTLNLCLYNFWCRKDFFIFVPVFHNAMHFVLGGSNSDGIGWQALDNLLHKLPKLEELVFLHGFYFEFTEEEMLQLQSSSELVPYCLLFHLRTVSFGSLCHRRNTFEVVEIVKYFLQNAKVLEKLVIYTYYVKEEKDMKARDEVLEFQRCSRMCQVIFDEH